MPLSLEQQALAVLGFDAQATPLPSDPEAKRKRLKNLYTSRSRAHHPDKGGTSDVFCAINQAYKFLIKETKDTNLFEAYYQTYHVEKRVLPSTRTEKMQRETAFNSFCEQLKKHIPVAAAPHGFYENRWALYNLKRYVELQLLTFDKIAQLKETRAFALFCAAPEAFHIPQQYKSLEELVPYKIFEATLGDALRDNGKFDAQRKALVLEYTAAIKDTDLTPFDSLSDIQQLYLFAWHNKLLLSSKDGRKEEYQLFTPSANPALHRLKWDLLLETIKRQGDQVQPIAQIFHADGSTNYAVVDNWKTTLEIAALCKLFYAGEYIPTLYDRVVQPIETQLARLEACSTAQEDETKAKIKQLQKALQRIKGTIREHVIVDVANRELRKKDAPSVNLKALHDRLIVIIGEYTHNASINGQRNVVAGFFKGVLGVLLAVGLTAGLALASSRYRQAFFCTHSYATLKQTARNVKALSHQTFHCTTQQPLRR